MISRRQSSVAGVVVANAVVLATGSAETLPVDNTTNATNTFVQAAPDVVVVPDYVRAVGSVVDALSHQRIVIAYGVLHVRQ